MLMKRLKNRKSGFQIAISMVLGRFEYFEIWISDSNSATTKTLECQVSCKSNSFLRFLFAIFVMPLRIFKHEFRIRNQRPQKPSNTKCQVNRS